MSKINVDTWEPESGTAATLMASGDTVTVPSGASLVVASGATINITGATQTGFPSAGFASVHHTTASSSTYTVPASITKLLVFITGGGGSGGSGSGAYNGSGGGGATTVIAHVTVVPADTITIAVGAGASGSAGSADGAAGGNTTFTHASGSGTFDTITAPGGTAGVFGLSPATSAPTAGTVGASNDGFSILGGYQGSFGTGPAGFGGATFWGGGGMPASPGYQVSSAGTAYGSGGGGGSSTTSYFASGAGADGICFIMEFK